MKRYFKIQNGIVIPSTDVDFVWCDLINPTDDDVLELSALVDVPVEILYDLLGGDTQNQCLSENKFLGLTFRSAGLLNPLEVMTVLITPRNRIITLQNQIMNDIFGDIVNITPPRIENPRILLDEIFKIIQQKWGEMSNRSMYTHFLEQYIAEFVMVHQ